MRRRGIWLRLAATALVAAVSTAAPAAQQGGDDVVLDTELVTLDVSVVDRGNRPVFDIGEERFQIAEDGAPQKIAFFSKEKAAVSLAIAVDTSGSMRSKLDSVVQATSNLVRASAPNDESAVIQFKDQVELVEEFTSDIGDVEDALNDLVSSGQTSLLDALMLAADYAQKDGRNRRKALVVVTDGLEKGSFYALDEVTEHLRRLDVRLYLIGFTTDLNDSAGLFKKSQKEKAETLLNKLAEDTGGRAFFPSDESQLGPVIDQIALDLRTVYAIGYYPTNTKKDGTFRKVAVTVLGPDRKADSKLSARTRAGYVAAKQ